jgi:glycosyltransferase involved in cell wall biosynthesis
LRSATATASGVSPRTEQWICCQIGARENYAIARALARASSLARLITDSWVSPKSLFGRLLSREKAALSSRFHEELTQARVTAFNIALFQFELIARSRCLRGWDKVNARNRWFQRKAIASLTSDLRSLSSTPPVLFSYSYATRDIFRFAKAQGWKTILGQIDPGPVEEEIVAAEVERELSLAPHWTRAPVDYWKSWRGECDVADRIIVNSQWSFDALVQTGIPKEKLSMIPLAFENNIPSVLPKEYPRQFTATRPLRVLFLGQITLRKGIARLLRVMRSLQSQPVEFLMVGPIQITIPEDLRSNRNTRWVGPVARNKAQNYYEQADVFILPTLSDGFALSQLEALANRLPVIASRRCGEVVIDHVNGLLLEEPTWAAIEEALRFCLHNPDQLAQFSENATLGERFSLSHLGTQLCTLAW